MLRYLTAGESHGPALTAILEGMPPGVEVEEEEFYSVMKKRLAGYGRGVRSKAEPDKVEILSGIVGGRTIGSPIALMIKNKDYINHQHYMSPFNLSDPGAGKINVPLPGHADLAGMVKYGFDNCRFVRERASARETAIRTAISVPARCFLKSKGVSSLCMVKSLGGIEADVDVNAPKEKLEALLKEVGEDFLTPDKKIIPAWKSLIDECIEKKISLGGTGLVIFYDLPLGLGSYVEYDLRLDARLAAAVMSIPAIKGVEIGNASELAKMRGNGADEIAYESQKGFFRKGNLAAGLEGGVTNGQPLVIKFYMKPLPANSMVDSVDLITKKVAKPEFYRSDVQAVTAASVVVESVIALELASSYLTK